MKKLMGLRLIFIIALCFLLGCSNDYDGWKKVALKGPGTIKIPSEWVLSERDGLIYISSKDLTENDCEVFFVQSYSYAGWEIGAEGCVESNIFSDNVQNMGLTENEVISNGAVFGKALYSVDGKIDEKLFLDLYRDHNRVFLVVWNNFIDETLLKKIAKSYNCLE